MKKLTDAIVASVAWVTNPADVGSVTRPLDYGVDISGS
jgi:hypothetical protein